MFTTYYSDSLETLARVGGMIMKRMRGSADLFVNEVIVTQNSGMFTYVKQVMTEENSIFALTRNVRLWPFIWDLARDILPDFPEDAEHGEGFDVFSRDSLKWNLMGALSRWQEAGEGAGDNPGAADSDLQYLRDYLNRPGITEAERTLLVYDLAAALADVYDQYQVYRPEWINQWMGERPDLTSWLQDAVKSVKGSPSSSDAAGLEKFKWEASLWKILEKNIKGVSEEDSGRELSRISRSRIISELKNLLSEKNLSPKEQDRIREAVSKRIPGRVFFYGISSVPPEILDILIALGRFTDVHFMFLNPCKEYWGDLRPVSKKETRERIRNIMRSAQQTAALRDIRTAGNQEPAGSSNTGHPLGGVLPLEAMPAGEGEIKEKDFENPPVSLNGKVLSLEEQLDELDKKFRNSGNPLLLSFGRRGRDMLALLTEKIAAADEAGLRDLQNRPLISEIAAYTQDYRDSSAPDANTSILERIRRDIFTLKNAAVPEDDKSGENNTENTGKEFIPPAADTEKPSLTITSCPTRLREVQVLYDRILALFDKEEDKVKDKDKEKKKKKNKEEDKEKDKNNEKDEELLPRDIIVMAPDISVYAPFIEGVFRGGNENLKTRLSPKGGENLKTRPSANENLKARLSANEKTASKNGELPIAICDRSMNDQNPVLAGVRTLLSISDPDTILSAHDVAALLNIEEIRRKCGLSEEDIPVIGNMLSDNNAMLGLDGDDVAKFRAGPGAAAGSAAASGRLQGRLEDVTIKQGINRMLLGSMMPCDGSDDKPWNADCEGDLVKALGVFAEFLAKLRDLKNALTAMSRKADEADSANPVTMNDWHAFIKNRILDVFFDLGERGTGIMNYLKRSFADAADSIDALREKPRLTLTLTLRFFDEILSGSDDGRSPFLRNAINFCTFVPMRSIPFKHVFMLGMNDGDFPANPAVPGFDLMREKPRSGDRNRPDDDRYMFLEAVLAAQKSLHISYLGISPGDGSERNPSIVVSELLDYVAASMRPSTISPEKYKTLKEKDRLQKMREAITRTATLNPSDPRNYEINSPCQSYQEQWYFERTGTDRGAPRHAIGEGIYPAGRLEPQNGEITITAGDLLKFVRDPEKYFLNRKLGMKDDYDRPAPASERFCFAFLEKGNLMQDAARLEASDPDEAKRQSFRDLLIRKGAFPVGNVGEYAWRDFEARIAALKNALAQMEPALPAEDEILMTVPDYSDVCIKLNDLFRNNGRDAENGKENGNEANKDSPFVPGSQDWLPWEIACLDDEIRLADEIKVGTEDADARDLIEEYRKQSGGQEPANVTVRITGISEVAALLYRNVMLDPWHKQDDKKFLLMKLVNAAMYVMSSGCPDLESRNFYAMAVKKTVAPDKDLVQPMTGAAAAKILRNTLKLYLLGQIAPLHFAEGSDYGSSSDSTRRNFIKAESILFDDMKSESDRNFRGICQAFTKFMVPGKNSGKGSAAKTGSRKQKG